LLLLGLAFSAIAPCGALAASKSTDKAMAAIQKGDFKAAMSQLQPLADKGDPDAQFLLGMIYDAGKGVPRDPAKAATWYQKAAEQKHTLGQLFLGVLYLGGEGVAKDAKQALRWFEPAAIAGNDQAQMYVGVMYAQGDGIRQDHEKAIDWLTRSAQQRNTRAMGMLATELFSRHRDDQDLVDAYKWSHLAAEEDAIQASLSTRAVIEQYCSKDQIKQAKKAMSDQKKVWANQSK